MTDFKAPRTEIEWSRRAIINVVDVLAAHAESLTLVGAHAVLLLTMDLDVPKMPTGDGDLGVTPGLVGDLPSIESLLVAAGYEHRTTARPGLWGRGPFGEGDGTRSFREKIDLLAPHGLSGTASRSKRGVPALQPAHGKLAVGNVLGLELAAFNRSLMTIPDFADSRFLVRSMSRRSRPSSSPKVPRSANDWAQLGGGSAACFTNPNRPRRFTNTWSC